MSFLRILVGFQKEVRGVTALIEESADAFIGIFLSFFFYLQRAAKVWLHMALYMTKFYKEPGDQIKNLKVHF